MKEVNKLLGLGVSYEVEKVEDVKEENQVCKYIYVTKTTNKERCPICNKYTRSVHDKLKPIKIKYVKAFEYKTYLIVRKRRFICYRCNKKFTEAVVINNENKSISNKLEQKILKDLTKYNLSLKYIAEENNVNDVTIRNILKNSMSEYPKNLKTLPRVII